MDSPHTFGQSLKEHRKALDMTQEDLAERVGCTGAAIRMIELGQRRPSRQVAGLLVQHLRIPEAERDAFLAAARGPLLPGQEHQETATQREVAGRAAAIPNNLPARPTSLIGRAEELATVTDLLLREEIRLLTLSGPPGIGKTSLAIEVATGLISNPKPKTQIRPRGGQLFTEGVFWVPLASVSEPEMVIPAIARALDVQVTGTEPLLDTLKRYLKLRGALLLLDNFEQVVVAASYIAELLTACPGLKVLVTSRERLNLRLEREFSVSALALPEEKNGTGETLAGNPAVALFVERAQAVDAHFSLTEENAPLVAAICARLDGLPLAIELVAARTRMLPVKALLARLQETGGSSPLSLLSGGARDLPERHRTLRDAIGWSYRLLDNDEQILFRRLGVFRGGFSLAAAEAVCNIGADPSFDLFNGVSQLLHKNLLKRERIQTGASEAEYEPRFTMLETIHEYAVERLVESKEAEDLKLLHVEYFLAVAAAIQGNVIDEHQRALLDRLDQDYDNIQAALAWTLEKNMVTLASQLGLSLSLFWTLRTHYAEGRDWLTRIIAAYSELTGEEPDTLKTRASLLLSAARLNIYLCNYSTARTLLEESLSIYIELGLNEAAWHVQINLGHVAWWQGDHAAAALLYETCLKTSRESGNKAQIASALWMLGGAVSEVGAFDRAEGLLTASLALAKEIAELFVTFGSLRDLATLLNYEGKYEEAIPLFEESIQLARYAKFQVGVSWATAGLAFAVLRRGNYARAEELYRESMALAKGLERQRIPDSLEGLAEVELARAQEEGNESSLLRAATLLGAAEAARLTLSMKIIPVRVPVRERLVSDVCAQLEEADYERAYALGRAMSLEEAISYA